MRGRMIYENHCANCHDNSERMLNDIGPALFGVVGRRVGSVAGYAYSPALRASGQRGDRWTAGQLDRFLRSPEVVHPGTNMPMNFARSADRKVIIAYLKTLKMPDIAQASRMSTLQKRAVR